MKAKSKSSTIGTIISTIIYILLISILAFSVYTNFNKKENEIVSLFGYAFAVVQSGSMTKAGFDVGDIVIIKETNTDTLKQGDIVVFYMKTPNGANLDPVDNTINNKSTLTPVDTETYVDVPRTDQELDRHDKNWVLENVPNLKLVFHEVIGVYVDDYGVRFFETKGASNYSADGLVREDFVCAKYVQSSVFLQSLFSFISSPIGLVIVVLIPISLMIISQFFSFGKELKGGMLAGKLIERKIKYTEVDFEKYEVLTFITPPEKVYLYDITPPEDKPNMAIILFDTAVEEVLNIYNKDRDEYYEYFALEMKNKDKQKLELLHEKANLVLENYNITEEEANAKAKAILKEKKSNAS